MSISRAFADFASGLTLAQVPERVATRARHLILDAVGTGLAAIGAPWAEATFAAAQDLGAGTAPVLGYGRTLGARDAALMNGLVTHGLDYDDTHSGGIIHATVSAFPAALVAADQAGASGADLLVAYIAAMEVSTRVAAAPSRRRTVTRSAARSMTSSRTAATCCMAPTNAPVATP